ncbi:MAG: chorismate-binding protein, partial [Actinomycetes bacterium]
RYLAAVTAVRELIAAGEVYQVNVCRTLSAAMPDPAAADVFGLMVMLRHGNPAPYGGCLRVPQAGIAIASASPELFLRRRGLMIESDPIKGTGRTAADLTPKDRAENVMIVDLVRNDLGRVCEVGTVQVPSLLRLEHHPSLVHLVSTIRGQLRPDVGWAEIFEATFAPGSVTGAPKLSALRAIAEAEPIPRGPYCGALGWVDADNSSAELAVAIRTFWLSDVGGPVRLNFGSGAGITWGSDPAAEWDETCLKASNLISVASGSWPADPGSRSAAPSSDG